MIKPTLAMTALAALLQAGPAVAQTTGAGDTPATERMKPETEAPNTTMGTPQSETGTPSTRTETTRTETTTRTEPTATVEFIREQGAGDWLASHLIGADVRNGSNEVIGDVNDLLFGTEGRLVGAVIGVGGFIGLGEKNVAVRFEALDVSTNKDGDMVVTLKTDKASLESAPTFKEHGKTSMTDKFKRMMSK